MLITISAKRSVLDVWQSSECTLWDNSLGTSYSSRQTGMTQNGARENRLDLMSILRSNSPPVIPHNEDPAFPTILCWWLTIKAIYDFIQS